MDEPIMGEHLLESFDESAIFVLGHGFSTLLV